MRASLLAGLGLFLVLWRVQAQDASRIAIDSVDASGFPAVVIDLAVVDDLGVPLPQLTAADFQIFEDGRKVPAGSIVLEPDESQPIGLVFAVDRSTEVADLEEIKSGLRTLISRMRTGDQALLLTFDGWMWPNPSPAARPSCWPRWIGCRWRATIRPSTG